MPKKAVSLALAFAAVATLACGEAAAQTFYKWTDPSGKVQYSDVPPKNFKGEVTRIEVEQSGPATSPRAPEPKATPPAEAKPPEDIAAKRRSTREHLEARLERAREKVATAKKALEDSEVPDPDERQVIQQRLTTGGMHGMAPRSNCRVERDGKGSQWLMCPTSIPTPEYQERVARLEENLKKAEEELAAAQDAWRRGVD